MFLESRFYMRHVDKNNMENIDLQYFGCIELYSTLINVKDIYFYPETTYEKALHPNRTVINGANGPIPLSIPLLGGRNQKGIFKDIQIAEDGNWRRIHWRSIHDSYRKSPWFEELGWQVEALYQKSEKFLLDWNLKTMQWAIKVLKLNVAIMAEMGAPAQIRSSKKESSIGINYFGNDLPVYQQVFMERAGFIPNLSIMDLLFCEGPTSRAHLDRLVTYKNNL